MDEWEKMKMFKRLRTFSNWSIVRGEREGNRG